MLLEMLLGHSQFDQMWLGVYKKEAKDLGDGTVLRRKLAHVLNELDPILFEHTGRRRRGCATCSSSGCSRYREPAR